MKAADLTGAQILVLTQLARESMSGVELRKRLTRLGITSSGPAFYQRMGRMTRGGLVASNHRVKRVDNQTSRECLYSLTEAGKRVCKQAQKLCSDVAATVDKKLITL